MAVARKKIGIWMDNSIAHLMEFSTNSFEIKTIESDYTNQEKINGRQKGQLLEPGKMQLEQARYYKKLIDVIKKYNEVILFGPTNAKEELFEVLNIDKRFENVKIQVKQTDKMTQKQQHAFVKIFFQSL